MPWSDRTRLPACGRPLIARQPFEATAFDEVIVGAAMPSADEANIGRVVSLRLGCGEKVPAWTVMAGLPAKPLREVSAEWRDKILEYGREQDKRS